MRGALEAVAGVSDTDVTPGRKEITVHYDASKTDAPALLAALQAAGLPATKM